MPPCPVRYKRMRSQVEFVCMWQALPGPEVPGEGTAAAPSSAPADGADFIPAETFSGSRLGYVFQAGTQGTGYYKDGVDKGLPPPPNPAGPIQINTARSA